MSYLHPTVNEIPDAPLIAETQADQDHSNLSSVAWSAVFAGAATAASLWMILMILGAGLGLSTIPHWLNADITAGTFGASTIAWMVFSTIAASGMGGYIAGRMRTRWLGVPRNEVWFRDTAHGFLAWAVSALVTAILLTAMIGTVVSDGIEAGAAYVESAPGTELTVTEPKGQSQSRLGESSASERALAEQARKAAATAAIWLFISLLAGAVLAGLMAIFGGRQRDESTGATASAGPRS